MNLQYWWNLADGYDWNHENKETDTEWYHRIKGNTLYLSFCGSSRFYKDKKLAIDWKQNFSVKRIPYKNMPKKWRVHKGFLEKWKSIRDEVLSLVTDEIKAVEISGFSQGSAVATLAHEDIYFNTDIEPTSVVFGAPRVVSWRAPKERWKNLTRIQLHWDMVPGLPWFVGGYKHVGDFKHVGRWPSFFRFWPWDHLKYWRDWS